MPIPPDQLKRLESDLSGHQDRMTSLRTSITNMSEEADVHDLILGLGRSKAILTALSEIYDNPRKLDELGRDPAGYARRHSIELPAGATLSVTGTGAQAVVEAHIKKGRFTYVLTWNREKGFTGDAAGSGTSGHAH